MDAGRVRRGEEPADGPAGAGAGGGAGSPGAGAVPRQTSLARIAEFGVVPKRSLGQNFLIDDNILGVILDRLGATSDDVVIEVGAGLGVLTRALAGAAARVHAFEIDRSLEAPLRATLADVRPGSVTIHLCDVLEAPLESLEPAPTLCASNLPYSVAGPFLAESMARLSGVRRYCVMVQREVAERIASGPGSKAYGGLSVWIQLHTRVVEVRSLARSIFHPRPNVDSCLVTLERIPRDDLVHADPVLVREVVASAFSQRRKLLVNALTGSLPVTREVAAQAMSAAGIEPGTRAEQLPAEVFVALAVNLAGALGRG